MNTKNKIFTSLFAFLLIIVSCETVDLNVNQES